MPRPLSLPRPRRATFRRTAALTVAAASTAVVVTPAHAGSYEQVTRATGAQGTAPFTAASTPVAVSDSGRYAVFSTVDYQSLKSTIYVRDIVANTTTPILSNSSALIGNFDKSETRFVTTETNADGSSDVWLRSTTGAPAKKITSRSPDEWGVSAALSGDGKVVAVATEGSGLVRYDTATGAVLSTTEASGLKLNGRAISDDGKLVAGTRSALSGFYVKADGTLVETRSPSLVSPTGSIIFSLESRYATGADKDEIVAQRLTDGLERRYTIPSGFSQIAWIAPDGLKLITGGEEGGRRLDLVTGTWSTIGGPGVDIAEDLTGQESDHDTAISRNGRYAVQIYADTVFSNELALVDLTGADLPGAQEPLSASSYLAVPAFASFSCATQPEANNIVFFRRPATWLPKPRLGTLKITVDGTTALNKVFTQPFDPAVPSLPAYTQVPFSTSAKKITITGSVIDDGFRVLSDKEVTAPVCLGGFGG